MRRQHALYRLFAALCLAYAGWVLRSTIQLELSRTQRCDTTYIHPEYITVPTPHFDAYEYSLVRYREKPSAWVPTAVTQRRGRAAVLFVHGHLGSYEQMRSMASESAKEISRRIKSSVGADADADAVDWFGADFLEEPSGLEPRLLERQAAYVAACVEYLSTSYDKVVLLGYSMGGLVVDRVLATDKAVSDKVAMAITIGSPHFHLPTLVIPTPGIGRAASSPRPPPRIPTLRVFSGPGDLLVPSISAWSVHARALASNDGEDAPSFEVDLENVPGVWGTASHKGLVSCNQLVRRVVPLILDGVRLGSPTDVGRLIAARMTSDVHVDMGELGDGIRVMNDFAVPPRETCATIHERGEGDDVFVLPVDGNGPKASCFVKRLDVTPEAHAATAGTPSTTRNSTMVQIALHGLKPGRDVRVAITDGDRRVGDLSNVLSPLPAMAIDEPTNNQRHWEAIIEGIDWMQNTTWFLEVSSEALRGHGANSLTIVLSDDVLASRSDEAPGRGFSVSTVSSEARRCTTAGCVVKGTSVISINVPTVFAGPLRLLKPLKPLNRFVPAVNLVNWKALAQFMPVKFVVEVDACGAPASSPASRAHRPVLVSKGSRGLLDSDQIRTGSGDMGVDVPLWHPSILSDTVFVIVDPTCRYTVVARPDVLPAMAYAVRYHAYALPGLLLALTILRVVPLEVDAHGAWSVTYPGPREYGCLLALMATGGAGVAGALSAWRPGAVPWAFLQTPLSIAAISWIAMCVDILFKSFACDGVNLASRTRIPSWLPIPSCNLRTFLILGVIAGHLLHDFAAFFVAFFGVYALAVSRANAARHVGGYSVVEGGLLIAYGVFPMVIAMSGGKIVSYPHRELYGFFSPERLIVALTSLAVVGSPAPPSPPSSASKSSSGRAGTMFAATVAAFSSLFGYCFVGPAAVVVVLVGACRMTQEAEKNQQLKNE